MVDPKVETKVAEKEGTIQELIQVCICEHCKMTNHDITHCFKLQKL